MVFAFESCDAPTGFHKKTYVSFLRHKGSCVTPVFWGAGFFVKEVYSRTIYFHDMSSNPRAARFPEEGFNKKG